jgi:hypothetical protein
MPAALRVPATGQSDVLSSIPLGLFEIPSFHCQFQGAAD